MHIKELILKTASVKDTRQFYHQTQGLEIAGEKDNSVSFRAGKTILTFEELPGEKPVYHFAFNIANNKFLQCFEEVKAKVGVLPLNGQPIIKYDNWNAESFYFYDNNGNIVEGIARYSLPYSSDKNSLAACIMEVSEIGLVTKDVQKLAGELLQKGIPYFYKGPVRDDFTALGDDYGLLLVCEEERGWVPTHEAAQVFPVTVITQNGQKIMV